VSSGEREITMLFTDVEGSTTLAQVLGERWAEVLTAHRHILRRCIEEGGGTVETTEGDSFFATFAEPGWAVRAAVEGQRELRDHRWPEQLSGGLRVRMGIHRGRARYTDGHWVGLEVHRGARIANAAQGGQVIVSETLREAIGDQPPCEDLGLHRLKDFGTAERLFQLRVDERVAHDFPPPRTLGRVHTIIDREAELRSFGELVEEVVASGRGKPLIIEGPPGIGKTSLLAELGGIASTSGMEALLARGAEMERDFPFGLVRQLLAPVAGVEDPDRGALLDGAAGLALGALGPAPETEADPAAVMHGLHWLVSGLAAERPLLLVVDDAQWGDEPSLRFLAYLCRRAQSLPILLAVGTRPSPEGQQGVLLAELAADPAAVHVVPAPLDQDGTARMLDEEIGLPANPAFVRACREATGGNPFLIGELARELRRKEIEPTAARAASVAELRPDRVAHSLALRVKRSGAAAEALAPAIAVLAGDADLALAGRLANLEPEEAAAGFDRLAREGLLLGALPPRYAHPLLRAAAADLPAPAERARLHARAAGLLEEIGAPVEQIASQVLEVPPGEGGRWVGLLAQAAHDARARGAPDVSVRLLERALAESPGRERPDLLYELGCAQRDLGRDAARANLRAAAASAEPGLAARATRALVWTLGADADAHRATAALLDSAIEGLSPGDAELRAELEAVQLASLWLVPDFADRLERELPRFQALEGGSNAESLALSFVARILMQRGEPAAAVATVAERAVGGLGPLRDDDMADLWLLSLVVVTTALDRLDLAEQIINRALAYAAERGSANRFALASNLRGMVRHVAGDLRGAEADARCALASEGLKGPMGYQSLIPLVGALAEQGRSEEGERELVERGLDGAIPEARPLTALLVERGRLRLAAGELAHALADLEDADRRLAPAASGRGAVGLDVWLERIMALRALGRRQEAASEAEAALAAAQTWGTDRAVGGALRVRGLLATDAQSRDEDLGAAVALLARSHARLLHAHALVDLGSARTEAGAGPAAIEPLVQGLELAEACGADPLAMSARRELAASGLDPPRRQVPLDRLRGLERRTAELAAEGVGDSGIAQSLFLTVGAVEAALSAAQRRLSVRSREELVDVLRRSG
jgi:class 3 adenylate cyclase/DNA-binding NarL/FixJ family response regulator